MACARRRYTNRRSVSAWRDEPPCAGFVHAGNLRKSGEALVALAQIAVLKRDNWPPCDPSRRCLGHFDGGFRQLLGNSEQMLAPLHFAPDVLGPHTGRRPQNGEIIKKVGAL